MLTRIALALAVLAPLSSLQALDQGEARHLLTRTGFGPTPDEIAELLPLTREQAVDAILAKNRTTNRLAPPEWCNVPLADNAAQRQAEEKSWKGLSEQERQTKSNERESRDRKRGVELKAWWYREMAATDSPLTERMVLFWHNHFTSSLTTVYDPRLMWEQDQLFRSQALGNFATLLTAIPYDPAMFIYLDSNSNINYRPNENFAREVMELFTVGEGFYTEADIKEAARSLSGYKIDEATGRPALSERFHDTEWKTVLGHKGLLDADQIMKILMEREERVAIHICEKLWQEFVSETIDAKDVYKIAAVFYKSKYDVKKAVRAVLLHPKFWDADARGTLIRSPVEMLVGTIRQLDLPVDDYAKVVEMGRALGEDILDPPNVRGWKGGSAWISTHSLLARREIFSAIAGGSLGNPNGKHRKADADTPAAGGEMAGEAMAPAAGAKDPKDKSAKDTAKDKKSDDKKADAKSEASSDKPAAGPHPDRGQWIPDARKQGTEGVQLAVHLLLPIDPVTPMDKDADLDRALKQLLTDPAYNLK